MIEKIKTWHVFKNKGDAPAAMHDTRHECPLQPRRTVGHNHKILAKT